jgi:hypothetical protein
MIACNADPLPDRLFNLFGCMHQEENTCGAAAEDLDPFRSVLGQVTLHDHRALISVLEVVPAACAYCIIETVAFVCGSATCVQDLLRLGTDYPVIPRPCLPGLVTQLASAQATAVRALQKARMPLGLVVADSGSSGLFIASGVEFGGAAVYRRVTKSGWLYRCADGADEVWALTEWHDHASWSRCEGRLWIDLETAQTRLDRTDRLHATSGLYVDLGLGRCRDVLATDYNQFATVHGLENGHVDGIYANTESTYSFREGASAVQVSCALLWWFGRYNYATARSVTVQLPKWIEAVELTGDVVVREGISLTIEASHTLLVVGPSRLQVEAGGRLELVRLSVVDSIGPAIVTLGGEVRAVNCTFERCVGNTNMVVRSAEASLVESDAKQSGALLSSWGGAILSFLNQSSISASGCVFADNAAQNAMHVASGGAICSIGGQLRLDAGTVLRTNRAVGGRSLAAGGAVYKVFGQAFVVDVVFSHNVADSREGIASRGGAVDMVSLDVAILSTTFESNAAVSATVKAVAGAAGWISHPCARSACLGACVRRACVRAFVCTRADARARECVMRADARARECGMGGAATLADIATLPCCTTL